MTPKELLARFAALPLVSAFEALPEDERNAVTQALAEYINNPEHPCPPAEIIEIMGHCAWQIVKYYIDLTREQRQSKIIPS